MDNKVSSINFNANLEIHRRTKLLSNTRYKTLKDKAKQIGNNFNTISLVVLERNSEITGKPVTYIDYARHNFEIDKPAKSIKNMAEVSGTVSSRAKQIYKIIDNYLDNIKAALSSVEK